MDSKKTTSGNGTSVVYQWAIATLIGLLCFLLGGIIQEERLKTQVVTNTVEIRTLKDGISKIEMKLDMVLARVDTK